ncbi:hypothetical protein EIP91_005727 [Steccherinum ochraceum]|uniref:RNase III domain-containing protein n=1 Tax=Steccherinum ochraceum TaxID=92696 RepID=A0A4R0RRM6_9APHY|nr:hypothetical protein EIP91_005727 [Steccherinum ochraceum]
MVDHRTLQKAIEEAIAKPSFTGSLPPLSEAAWRKIVVGRSQDTVLENDRLEFLGDALMYATIGRLLYAKCPQGTPYLYTSLRSALHSNATFSKLAEKLDILAVSSVVLNALTQRTFGEGSKVHPKQRPQVKATADLFETVIGAYYLECGFESLCNWVTELYEPLITAGKKVFQAGLVKQKKRQTATLAAISKKVKQSTKHSTPLVRKLASRKGSIYSPGRTPAPAPQPIFSGAAPMLPFPMVPSAPNLQPQGNPFVGFPPVPMLPLPPPANSQAQLPVAHFPFVPVHMQSAIPPLPPSLFSARPPPNTGSSQRATRVLRQAHVRLPTPRRKVATPARKLPPVVIDLTLDDDSPPPSPKAAPVAGPSGTSSSQNQIPTGPTTSETDDEADELEDMLISDSEDEIPMLTVFS